MLVLDCMNIIISKNEWNNLPYFRRNERHRKTKRNKCHSMHKITSSITKIVLKYWRMRMWICKLGKFRQQMHKDVTGCQNSKLIICIFTPLPKQCLSLFAFGQI